MSKAAEFNGWCIVVGADFRQVFIVRDPTQDKIDNPDFDNTIAENSQNPRKIFPPKDLTGFSAEMDIREEESKTSTALIEMSDGSGISIGLPDPTTGVVEIFIDNTVTNASPISDAAGSKAFYDFFLTDPSADKVQILKGTIRIEGTVTDV